MMPILEVLLQIVVKSPPMLLILVGAIFHVLADPLGITLIFVGVILQILWLFRPLIFAAAR
jgi:hypothetical protein